MADDIGKILRRWPYDSKNSIRKVIDADGTEKIQVRVDQGAFQGVLQMELDGRPDGGRPHDRDFALDFYREALEQYSDEHGSEEGFSLNRESCEELFDESRRIYERYVFLLQVQDYARVIRDTDRNMDMFRFINRYAVDEADRMNLEKWWPYIIRLQATARALLAAQEKKYGPALKYIREAKERIDGLEDVDAEEFHAEKKRSFQALDELAEELAEKQPLSLSERLQKDLAEAIEREEFERAAEIRDRIHELEE